jgi:hypothetical protein
MQAIIDRIMILGKCGLVMLGFPGSLELFDGREHLPKGWLLLSGKGLLDSIRILLGCQFLCCHNKRTSLTTRI